ncbi:MAG: hypothetical protein DRP71_10385 [Verrucomicrobia bacterium]|nr:MAG: hypothetical protein DRP71_10385 [Verrucomicrobiota bacterium]
MGHGDQNLNLPGGLNFAPDEARVSELDAMMIPQTWHLARPCEDRESWERVRESEAGRRLIKEARGLASEDPLSVITNEDCLYVMETGDRSKFNPLPLVVRARMSVLPIVECLDPTGMYLSRIEDDIRMICALNSWTFPMHVKARAFHERREIFTDLASVHFAGILVATLHMLENRLSPEIRTLIREELDTRIFQPFEERVRSGQDVFWWVMVPHNWNSVCLSCILGCALSLKEDPHERAWYLAVVEKLIKHSEDGFEPSGFYIEGVGYWGYGYSHYILAAELARAVTRGKIDWLKQPRVEAISHFGYRMEIQEGAYPTFADCKREVLPPQWLMHWLNNRVDPSRLERSTEVATNPFDPIHYQFAEILHLLLLHQVDINHAYAGPEERGPREWFEDVQFLISRPGTEATTRLAATFKGGHNGSNHNHNDLGTFTVLVGREELLTDPGAEIYTKRTFSRQRYEGNLLNSFGHPVPVVAGELQFPDKTYHRTGYGRDAYTLLVARSFTPERDRVVIEMDRAYRVPTLINLIRAFTYDRTGEGSVEVWDKIKYSEPQSFETALITYGEWDWDESRLLRVSQGGEAIEVEVSTDDGDLEFAHCIIQESSTPTRLSWRFKEPVKEASIRFLVRPVRRGKASG